MNKMEGHWQHMKVSLPVFGTRKDKYSFYLAEFIVYITRIKLASDK